MPSCDIADPSQKDGFWGASADVVLSSEGVDEDGVCSPPADGHSEWSAALKSQDVGGVAGARRSDWRKAERNPSGGWVTGVDRHPAGRGPTNGRRPPSPTYRTPMSRRLSARLAGTARHAGGRRRGTAVLMPSCDIADPEPKKWLLLSFCCDIAVTGDGLGPLQRRQSWGTTRRQGRPRRLSPEHEHEGYQLRVKFDAFSLFLCFF
jgi:hypothetical protein